MPVRLESLSPLNVSPELYTSILCHQKVEIFHDARIFVSPDSLLARYL